MNNFGLGYAPDSFHALLDAMTAKGYTKEELFAAGLIVRSQKGTYYDKFRNRVMFPIIDIRGDVIAFGGRVMDDSKPKYLNSPETVIFNKSRNLFAINAAKKTKNDYFLLAEGYMDVIALHQAGFDSAVASLGTSLTEEQARLLSRYTKNVIICYDADSAGQNAAQRAIDILGRAGLSVRVLRIPGAKDPDEFIKANGSEAFRKLIERSENHIMYRLQNIQDKYDLTQDDQRVLFLKEAAREVAALENAVEREVYTARAAKTAGVTPQAFSMEVKNEISRRQRFEKKRYQREIRAAANAAQPKDRSLHYDNVRSARAEEGLLGLIFADASLIPPMRELISPVEFSSDLLGKIYAKACDLYDEGHQVAATALEEELSAGEMDHLAMVLRKPIPNEKRSQAMQDYVNVIKACTKQEDEDSLLRIAERKRHQSG
jgi:DNA primase